MADQSSERLHAWHIRAVELFVNATQCFPNPCAAGTAICRA